MARMRSSRSVLGITIAGFALATAIAPAPLRAQEKADVVVIVSADSEWAPAREILKGKEFGRTPFGEFARGEAAAGGRRLSLIYLHGGWGKTSAAASAQYAIDRWAPRLIVNLGTCGGFDGRIKRDDVLLVRRTVVYDIVERMGDAAESIAFYSTPLDPSWLAKPYPHPVIEGVVVSADRDLDPADIPRLESAYGAVAADWESGPIAWTAARNKVPCLILRAVSDLVGTGGSEAYGNLDFFKKRAREIMSRLIGSLPGWLEAARGLFK